MSKKFPFFQREAREFVQDPSNGNKTYKVRNEHTGELEPVWQYRYLEAGDEFAGYVRRCGYCQDFPPRNQTEEQVVIEHPNLWPNRQLRILFFAAQQACTSVRSEIWSPARVVSWKEISHRSTSSTSSTSSSSVPGNATAAFMEWTLQVEFDFTGLQFRAGDVVQLKGLTKQHKLNGQRGVVSDSCLDGDRYRVIIMDFEAPKKVKVILAKPDNLERVRTMEFIVHRMEIRCGGVLQVTPPLNFSPSPLYVTFHWVQDLLPTGPYWWSKPDTPWLNPFSAQDGVYELRSRYQSEMEACLEHEDDEEKTSSLVRMKDELKSSLQSLTRNGNPMGMREARLLILTKPLVIALAAMKELALEAGDNLYIIDVFAEMYKTEDLMHFEIRQLTLEQKEVCRKLGLDCDSAERVRSLLLSLFSDVAMSFLHQKEYKKALIHSQGATGDGFLDRLTNAAFPSIDFLNDCNRTFGEAWRINMTCAAAMGHFQLLENFPPLAGIGERAVREEYDQWIGTSGRPATDGVSWIEEKYDAEAIAWNRMVTKITNYCLGTLDPSDQFL